MVQVKQSTNKRWIIWATLILIMGVAFLLRLINIEVFSFWTDEGLTPLRASYAIPQILRNDAIIQGIVTKDTHPPFFYLIIHFTRQIWGESDFAYRFPSALAGVLLVPVMYQFGRRLRGVSLGLLVAVLTAVNPLQIWYANEARMYTILVLLLALASYVLWRALTGAPLVRSLILYLVLAGLAFYTHYTAVFLIAAQALFWVGILWQQGKKKLIIGVAFVGLLAAIPLIPFTIPRLFSGAEANFFYVNPQVMLQDVIRFFHLGLTVDYSQPHIQVINILVAGLLVLGFYAARTWKCRTFLFVYLLAVVFGLMAGSLLKPMYQGVRHIMAGSPAFLLLISWGVVFAWENTQQKKASRWLWAVVGTAGVFVVFGGSLLSLNNLYNHPEIYGKDDFRSLVRYIESNAGDNDILVYNNAILLPFHDHYQQRADLPVTAVPQYPQKAVAEDQTLIDLANQYDRIWLITDPPADHRDDDKLVQQWLESELITVDQHREFSQNGNVESITFSTLNPASSEIPADSSPVNIHWSELPILKGIDIESPINKPALWLSLYWDSQTKPSSNTEIQFVLQDSSGKTWFTYHLPLLADEHMDWPKTGMVQLPYFLPLPSGLPPGEYTLSLQPLADDKSTPIDELKPVTTLTFAGIESSLLDRSLYVDNRISFDNGLQMAGWHVPNSDIKPGHVLPLTIYWESDEPLNTENLRYELAIIAEDGTELRRQSEPIAPEWLTTLPVNTFMMTPTGIYFPPEVEPGRYELGWQVWTEDQIVQGKTVWQPWAKDQITLGTVEVVPWPLETELPSDVTTVEATFGSTIDLYGYTVDKSVADELELTLVWQATEAISEQAFVFVHIVSADTADIVTQEDRVPGNTLRPTNGWRAGEVVSDTFNLTLPQNIESGTYQIMVGFYNPDNGVRLPVDVDGELQAHDQLPLTTVTLP